MPTECKPIGPTNSPLLALVGEAPGQEEQSRGVPFVGQSGQMLDQMLRATGIARNDCYITNVANTRPPGNRFSIYYSDAKRTKPTLPLLECRKRVKEELRSVRPKVIVALGEEALRAVANVTGITVHRGSILDFEMFHEPFRVLPTYHPSNVLRAYEHRPIVELDLRKAIRQARRPSIPKMNFTISPTFDQVMRFLKARFTPVSFDIETIAMRTRTLGFAWSPTNAISIPLISHGRHAWSHEEETLILQELNAYLGDTEIHKYVQNSPFDCSVVANELGIHVDGVVLDTMYAQHLLYPELPKSLDFISSIYTDFPMYWGKSKNESDENNATYNCYDCCATWIAAQQILLELDERHLKDFYYEIVHPTIFALTRMQNRGILMDTKARDIVRASTQLKLDTSLAALHKIAGREVNPNSPKQVQELIYGEWKLPIQRKPGTKAITTDDDALRALGRKYPSYAGGLRSVLGCRKTRKLISTYIEAELDNGYIRTSYGLTKTGRISSSQTIEGYGGNLQNIPRGDFRRLYIPDPGKVIIKADLSQAEYMVFCWDAPVPEFIHAYTTDPTFDVHRLNAARIFKIEEAAVTPAQRYDSKQGVYAGNYGIGPLKLSKMHDMDFHQSKTIIEGYKRSRPELSLWWSRIEDQIKATRTLRNVFGRERIFFGRIDSALFRAAYDWICQSTVADLINQALVTLDELEYEVLLQVHDELVLQCEDTPESIYLTVEAVRNAMEIPLTFPNVEQPLVIPADIAVGPNWFDVKEYVTC